METVKTRDELFDNIKDMMDFSNYYPKHPSFSNARRSEPGAYKDESCAMYDYDLCVSLAPKQYALRAKPICQVDGFVPANKNK